MKILVTLSLFLIAILNAETLFEVKDALNNKVLDVSTDGIAVMNLGDTLMVISTTEIKAVIDDSKALSRKFSVSTTSAKKGLYTDLFQVDMGSATMRGGLDGGRYADFSPLNMFLGLNAGQSTTGSSNVFIGNNAGFSNTSGGANVFIGHEAGYSSVDKVSNTYVGHAAGKESTGGMNAFFGYASGYTNKGSNNSFFGQNSGSMNATGSNNCLFGYFTGVDCDGNYNTMIGTESGKTNDTGSGNVFLGYRSGMNETGSNRLYIDNSETSAPLVYGEFDTNNLTFNTSKFYVKHTSGTTNGLFIQNASYTNYWHLYQYSSGGLSLFYNGSARGSWDITSGAYTALSDEKLKKNITDLKNVSEKIMKLSPKNYNFISQEGNNERKYIGLIAQEVQEIFPEFVYYNEEDNIFTIDYSGLSVVAIQAFKEQHNEIDKLRKENESIKERLAEIETALLKIR